MKSRSADETMGLCFLSSTVPFYFTALMQKRGSGS